MAIRQIKLKVADQTLIGAVQITASDLRKLRTLSQEATVIIVVPKISLVLKAVLGGSRGTTHRSPR